ncbi:hypothetical protein [uncultured Enterococcus sp.]|uniref:hypothetical protein n=1 Tax=uncultured Enterococcus sp. TaxID=167972 RepID=UPI0028064EED|nr:hypothetical protein [uncultured Enterococcus sp.]
MADPSYWNEIYQELVKLIGSEHTLLIYQEFHEQQISYPMRLISADAIKRILLNEYDGTNLKKLAKTYGYSERHLQRLLADDGDGGSKSYKEEK